MNQTPIYFHRDESSGSMPFYFVSFGPGAPNWITGENRTYGLGSMGGLDASPEDEFNIERVEAQFGAEYERLIGPGQKAHVGYLTWFPDKSWEIHKRDPSEVHVQREYPSYEEES